MGVCTLREDYRCHDDCEMSGCPGHQTILEFSTTTEGYVWTPAPGVEPVYFDRSQAAALLSMMRQLSENRFDSAAYFPRGYVLVPRVPTGTMLMAGGDVEEIHVEYGVDPYVENPEAIWDAMLAARPAVP